MALADSLGRLAAGTLLVARQRLELAALDLEEELLLAARFIVGALVTSLLATLALAALAATVVVAFWDSAPVAALAAVTLCFGAGAAAAGWAWSRAWRARPPLLEATLAELRKDAGVLTGERP